MMMNRLHRAGSFPVLAFLAFFNPLLSFSAPTRATFSATFFGEKPPLVGPVFTVFPQNTSVDCSTIDIQQAFIDWRSANDAAVMAIAVLPATSVTITSAGPATVGELCNSSATVVFTATDNLGAQTTTSTTFTVVDNQLPVYDTPPSTSLLQCTPGAAGQLAGWIHARAGSDASDNCTFDEFLLFKMKIAGTFVDSTGVQAAFLASQNLGCRQENVDGNAVDQITAIVTVDFIVEDQCGQAVSLPATFALQDTTRPAWTTAPQNLFQSCSNQPQTLQNWLDAHGGGTAVDACGSFVYSQNSVLLQQNCPQNGSWRGFFTATDGCGNAATRTATFSILDTVAPTITAQQTAFSEACGGGDDQQNLELFINQKGGATLADNCSAATWTDFTFSTNNGQTGTGFFGTGPYPTVPAGPCNFQVSLVFRAADACSNAAQKAMTWQIVDASAPVWAFSTRRDTLACQLGEPAASQPSVADNCDQNLSISMISERKDSLCGGRYALWRTWTATDDCANSATATQIFVFLDTVAPALSAYPANVTVECDAVAAAAVLTVSDNCSGVPLGLIFAENSTKSPDPTVCANHQYQITRTWTATDGCGNVRNWAQNVQVRDTQGPAFSGNPAPQIACDSLATIPVPTAADGCGGPVSAVVQLGSDVILAGPCADSYQLKKEWASTDVCGNQAVFVQISQVSDLKKPVLAGIPAAVTVDCQPPAPPVLGQNGFVATDNCDPTPTVILNQTTTQDPSAANCDHYNFWITREWLVTDNCGNAQVYSQTIRVVDQSAPELEAVDSMLVPNGPGLCGVDISVPSPAAFFDVCQSAGQSAGISQTQFFLNTSGQPDLSAPVDDLVFSIVVPNGAANQATVGLVNLLIDLTDADAEQPTEFFQIFGENGEFLGQTAHSTSQCGASQTVLTVSSSLFNEWKSDDGAVDLRLKAASGGTDAINKICSSSSATVAFSYTFLQPSLAVDLRFRIDGGALRPFPPAASDFLTVGFHVLEYVAADCSGNRDSTKTVVEVRDIFPPAMTPPADATVFVGANDCSHLFTLPTLASLSDNCGFSEAFDAATGQQLLKFYNDANAGFVPVDQVLAFSNVVPNAVGPATFRLKIRADDGDAGEFFQLLDENGGVLGQPNQSGASQCLAATETVFTFSAAQINGWAADGNVEFKLRPNRDAIAFSDFVSPCAALAADSTDGQSFAEGRLQFGWADIDFEAKRPGGGPVVASGKVVGGQSKVLLPAGTWQIFYRTADVNDNVGETSFEVVVRDTVAPKAVCQGSTITVNPSGLAPQTIQPQQIDGGSTDNCSALTFSVSPAQVNCLGQSANMPATLTVTDSSGNSATCQTIIQVVSEKALPTYQGYLCQSDTLFLFANPPGPSNQFTYQWTGPNGFSSTAENPFVPGVSLASEGSFIVRVKGLTNCISDASVTVDIQQTPETPVLQALGAPFCEGSDLILKTQTYADPAANYRWFKGIFPGGQLLGQGIQPQFLVVAPAVGAHDYYVIVDEFGCTSPPSSQLLLAVTATPTAQVAAAGVTVCEGESFALQALPTAQNYQWTGPNGFVSTSQQPPVFQSATLANGGQYILKAFENGCPSAPTTVDVLVKDAPPQPLLAASGAICAGGTVNLVSDVTNGEKYIWYPPNFPADAPDTTVLNGFSIQNATPSVSGNWRLVVFQQGCPSPQSLPTAVTVKAFPAVAATNNGPSCVAAPVTVSASTNQQNVVFEWAGPNGFQSFSPSATISQPAPGNYVVMVTNDIGCSTIDTTVVVVAPKPTVVSLSHDAPACENILQNITLSALVSPPSPDYVYEWTGPNGWSSSDVSPVLPSANFSWNGSYTLVVNRAVGNADCESAPKSTTIFIKKTPETPTISPQNALCEGDNLSLSVANSAGYPPSVGFVWQTPLGNVQNPTLSISNVTATNAGQYTVAATVNGCPSAEAAAIVVEVNPIPVPPMIQSNSPICEGEDLLLEVPLVAGRSYAWFGQNGFSSSVYNPTIVGASLQNAGTYLVQVTEKGCVSPFSQPENVVVNALPAVPSIAGPSQICLDQPGAALVLTVSNGTATAGASYDWYQVLGPGNLAFLGTTGAATTFNYLTGNQFSEGTHRFAAVAKKSGCSSTESAPFSIDMFKIPAIEANAGLDFKSCLGLSQTLKGESPAVGTGFWRQLSGPQTAQISNPTAAETAVLGISATGLFRFEWAISNGACTNFSLDTVLLTVNQAESANAGPSIDTCFATSARLAATLPAQAGPGGGSWSQPLVQQALGIVIDNPADPKTTVSNLNPGNAYTFFWNLADFGCGPTTDDMLVNIRAAQPDAGADRAECGTDDCEPLLAAALLPGQSGTWTSPDPTIEFFAGGATSAEACGLKAGQNLFVWQIDGGFCGNLSRDTAIIFFEPAPEARADSFGISFGQLARMNVTANDFLTADFDVSITFEPKNGTLTQVADGIFEYLSKSGFSGEDLFIYKICDPNCPDACSTAEVRLRVEEQGDCTPPTVLTPNGDNVNDFFIVPCLGGDAAPKNEVYIFNEWGDEVFFQKPYKQRFDGTWKGQDLPAGTYFYLIKFDNASAPKTGFLIIHR